MLSAKSSTPRALPHNRAGRADSVSVLVVCWDGDFAEKLNRRLVGLRYSVMQAASRYEATPLIEYADILVLRMDLPDKNASHLLQEWVRETGGRPALCLEDSEVTHMEVNEHLTCAWCCLAQPYDDIHIMTVMQRLEIVIHGLAWGEEVAKLKRQMLILALATAGIAAQQIGWPLLQKLLDLF